MGTRKTGVPTMLSLARRLCDLIDRFSPVIRLIYPENTAVIAALEAARTSCALLQTELTEIREFGD